MVALRILGNAYLKNTAKGMGSLLRCHSGERDSLLMPYPECFALTKATASIVCVKQKLVFLKSLLLEKQACVPLRGPASGRVCVSL